MKMKIVVVLVSILIFLLCGLWFAHNKTALKSKLDAYVTAYANQGLFSGTVLVAKDGKIVLCKGYGMANYEYDIAHAPQTILRLGSVSKQFTAMAIMQLQEKGLLHISDPIAKYIPDYPHGDKITIHHLLTHTSGIPNITDFAEYPRIKRESYTPQQLIEIIKNKPVDFQPGEKYQYSNSGYILLSCIIEKTSGKSYQSYIKENIFTPLGMYNSGYDDMYSILKNRASGYTIKDDATMTLAHAEYIDMSLPLGSGGLYSTVQDLYLWDRALYTTKLVSSDSLATIFKPQVKVNDTMSYAYGWGVAKVFSQHMILEHSGGIDGFSTDICRYPDDNVCIIILSNIENSPVPVGRIAQQLGAIVFGQKYTLPKKHVAVEIPYQLYDQYVGTYTSSKKDEKEGDIVITKEDTILLAKRVGQTDAVKMYPESETSFFAKAADVQISFVKNNSGAVVQLIMQKDGNDSVFEKIQR